MGINVSIDYDKITRSRVYLTRLEDAAVLRVDNARESLERELARAHTSISQAEDRLVAGQRASLSISSPAVLGSDATELDAASAVYNEALDAYQTVIHFINAIREEIGS